MRPRIRSLNTTHQRALPERSRLTVGRTVAALRRSREALVNLDGQLGDLLVRLRTPGATLDSEASERLADAKSEAMAAMSSLSLGEQLFA
jgi:hypothetical protein